MHGSISHSDSLDLLSLASGIQGSGIAVAGSQTVLQPVRVRGSVLSHRRTSSAPDVHTTSVAAAAVLNANKAPVRRRSLQQHARRHHHSTDTTEQQQQQQQLQLQPFTVGAQLPRRSATVNNETAEDVTAVDVGVLPPVPNSSSGANERHAALEAVDSSSTRSSDASTLQIGLRSSNSSSSSTTANCIATSPVKLLHSGRLRQGRLRVVASASSTTTATLLPVIDAVNTTGTATEADGAVEQRHSRAAAM